MRNFLTYKSLLTSIYLEDALSACDPAVPMPIDLIDWKILHRLARKKSDATR
jgi:hypothetical protein